MQLILTPAQYKVSSLQSVTDTIQRQYDALDLRLYYSDHSEVYTESGNVPALASPPSISQISSVVSPTLVVFSVRVVGDPAAGIQEVWVTYTAEDGPWAGVWHSLDLIQDSLDTSLWQASLDLGATDPADIRFMVQAVNGVGLVSWLSNWGAYYRLGEQEITDPDTPLISTTLEFVSPSTPISAAYGDVATFTIHVDQPGIQPWVRMSLEIGLGSQAYQAVSDDQRWTSTSLA